MASSVIQRVNRALKYAGVGQIELVTLRTQQFTCLLSLLAPLLGEVDIDQPVKRFSRFHWLWPWRMRTSLCIKFSLVRNLKEIPYILIEYLSLEP